MEWQVKSQVVCREILGSYLGDKLIPQESVCPPCQHAEKIEEIDVADERVRLWTLPIAVIIKENETIALCLHCLNEIAGKEALNIATKPGTENHDAIEAGKQ